jgi:hypothetical protein
VAHFERAGGDQRAPARGTRIEIFIDTPEQAFGEYAIETKTAAGRTFSQLYAGRLVAANGEIKLLRESLDVVRAARAIGSPAQGLKDLRNAA